MPGPTPHAVWTAQLPAARPGTIPMEGVVHLRKIASFGGAALLSVSLLAGCGGGSDDNSASGGASGGGDCPLVDADDPGNSAPPSGVPTADSAPPLAQGSS